MVLAGVILSGFLVFSDAQAAQVNTQDRAYESKTGPQTDEVLSFGDLLGGVENLLPSWSSGDESASKKKPAAPAKDSKNGSEPSKGDIPVKHTPDPTPTTPDKPSSGTAYRIYPSPYVPEAPVAPALPGTIGDDSMEPPMPQQGTAANEPTPPLLKGTKSGGRAADDMLATLPAIQSLTAQGLKADVLPPPPGPLTAPVIGMVRQYFPILPPGTPDGVPPQLLPLASNHDLRGDQSGITRAVIVIHDIARDASEVLAMMTTLAGMDNATTLILAPQFLLEIDITRFLTYLPDQGQGLLRWPVSRSMGWQTGEDSQARSPQKGISSFMALDFILLYLADRGLFPNLQQIVIAGHGMGADFVQRYAAVGYAPSMLAQQKLPVRFLVANASSYLYFTGTRPVLAGDAFGQPDTTRCAGVNNFPYGLSRFVPYARRYGGDSIRLRYPERQVMYLLSEKIAADPFLDTGCAAMMQGKDRLARGRNYARHLSMSFGDTVQKAQTFVMVPSAAYDPVALFGSYCGMAMLFGDGNCGRE